MKLNIGCGGRPLEGYINLDKIPGEGVDCVYNLEHCDAVDLPYPEGVFIHMLMHHVIEHITNILPMMEELYRVAAPGCSLAIACPYGSSDNADEDPTHVRRMFPGSFHYFSQAYYGANSYEYTADWDVKKVILRIYPLVWSRHNYPALREVVLRQRNIVAEMFIELIAVKPAREPGFQPTSVVVDMVRHETASGS